MPVKIDSHDDQTMRRWSVAVVDGSLVRSAAALLPDVDVVGEGSLVGRKSVGGLSGHDGNERSRAYVPR